MELIPPEFHYLQKVFTRSLLSYLHRKCLYHILTHGGIKCDLRATMFVYLTKHAVHLEIKCIITKSVRYLDFVLYLVNYHELRFLRSNYFFASGSCSG